MKQELNSDENIRSFSGHNKSESLPNAVFKVFLAGLAFIFLMCAVGLITDYFTNGIVVGDHLYRAQKVSP